MTANSSNKLRNPIAHKKLKFNSSMKSQLSKGNIFNQSFFMLTISQLPSFAAFNEELSFSE